MIFAERRKGGLDTRKSKSREVDEYIAKASKPAGEMLKQIRAAIRAVAPEAIEKISYRMPFYEYRFSGYKGRLAYFAAFKDHVSFFAIPGNVPAELAKKLEPYKAAKATLQFPLGTKVPVTALKKLVKSRKDAIDGDKPRELVKVEKRKTRKSYFGASRGIGPFTSDD